LETRYADETGDDAVLSTLSINISPRLNGGRKSYGAVSKHGGRHSVAADVSGTGPLTLRDQEQASRPSLGCPFAAQLTISN